MTNKEITRTLLNQEGVKEFKNVVVRNVTITDMGEYVRLGLSLNKGVPAYVTDEQGVVNESESNIIFTSTYAIASILKDNEDAAFAANHLIEHPTACEVLLSRASIDIIQQRVNAGTEYSNPYSTNTETTTFDHDVIINHIVNIEFSNKANSLLDTLAVKLLGF